MVWLSNRRFEATYGPGFLSRGSSCHWFPSLAGHPQYAVDSCSFGLSALESSSWRLLPLWLGVLALPLAPIAVFRRRPLLPRLLGMIFCMVRFSRIYSCILVSVATCCWLRLQLQVGVLPVGATCGLLFLPLAVAASIPTSLRKLLRVL